MNASNPLDAWMLNLERRIKEVRPSARIIWQDGGSQRFYHRGYYIVWQQYSKKGGLLEDWAKYLGIGDARTAVLAEQWFKEQKKG